MVKLESHDGRSLYVVPEAVKSVAPSGIGGCSSVDVSPAFFVVKGTPDEVHAKLFPTHPVTSETMDDVVTVLEWVDLQVSGEAVTVPAHVIAKARKALGREGA